MCASASKDIIIDYKGPIDFDTIGDLIGLLKEKMFEKKVKQTIYKKLLIILIESLENVFRYNDTFENDPNVLKKYTPEFTVIKKDEKYYVKCVNTVLESDVSQLKQKLNILNSLDKEGVRNLYKERITDGQFSEKGGAGLGMIEMAKITEGKLDYTFETINKKYSRYTLMLIVNSL